LILAVMGWIEFGGPAILDNDGYYHIRWAAMLRENWPHLPAFKALPLTTLNEQSYVDHHYLFHVLLIPFTMGDLRIGAKLAAVSAVVIYAFWRFVKFRMDSYIASNPLPSADVTAEAEDDAKIAASRLRTLMPLLRAIAGSVIVVVGGLLVLSELGVNITPLIAGASVFGLAVSFGSQSLVRDIVSGMFFLAEDSFRIGEYVDCSKVKGTVEGFSVRSLKLRHQNGQLHIVPFGQVAHITNFSRDWTVVKFNLAFANGTDVELLRKTVKKIGTDMMEEPAFKPILLQPLKMQGVVDIKDNSLIVRFKFMARPKNPSLVQRMAIRRMYESFPALGIQFATSPYPFAMAPQPAAPLPAAAPVVPLPPPAKAAE